MRPPLAPLAYRQFITHPGCRPEPKPLSSAEWSGLKDVVIEVVKRRRKAVNLPTIVRALAHTYWESDIRHAAWACLADNTLHLTGEQLWRVKRKTDKPVDLWP